MQDDIIELKLKDNHVGQIIDGLNVLIEQWDATREYMETGESKADFIIRECNDAEEAAAIADFYREIEADLRSQMLAASKKR